MKENNKSVKDIQPTGGTWLGGTYGHYDEELGWVQDGTTDARTVEDS